MNALEISNLTKRRGSFTLEGLDLTLPGGCIMGLIGDNGAGKSTTIGLILGMLKADGGTVRIFGRDSATLSARDRADIGVVFDEACFTGCLNAGMLGRVMGGIYPRWDAAAYAQYLRRLDVPADKAFKELSRGNRMKLSIAAALSHGARLLILDEATSGLDPVVRDEFTDILCEFTRDEDHSVLMSSHIVSDLEKTCDYIAFLHQGRLMLCEEKDRLYEKYGVLRCTAAEAQAIAPDAIVGRRDSAYGVELLVAREAVPAGLMLGRASIEDLFIFMAKEGAEK